MKPRITFRIISGRSDRIVGRGTDPEGRNEAWLVSGFPNKALVFTRELV